MKGLILFSLLLISIFVFSSFISAIDCDGLQLLMHLDNDPSVNESNYFVYDWSENNNYGFPNINATYTPNGRFNGAYEFYGREYIEIMNPSLFDVSDSWTYSTWIYPRYFRNPFNDIFGKSVNDSLGFIIYLGYYGLSNLTEDAKIGVTSIDTSGGVFSGVIKKNQWNHVVVTYDGTHISFFIDGIDVTIPEYSSTSLTNYYGNSFIGSDSKDPYYNMGFIGTIDEVALWDRTLSNQEVLELHNSGVLNCSEPSCVAEPILTTCGSWVCGTRINNSGDSINCGTCSSGYHCTSGSCAPDVLPCDLISALWSNSSVVEGTTVSLNLQGTNCDGKQISFEVWEDDSLVDDLVSPGANNTFFSGSSAQGLWNSLFTYPGDDDLGDTPRTYYFTANVIGENETINSGSPLLTVSIPGETCEYLGETCMNMPCQNYENCTSISLSCSTGYCCLGECTHSQAPTCFDLGGICKIDACNTYDNCSTFTGPCISGNCCTGACTSQLPLTCEDLGGICKIDECGFYQDCTISNGDCAKGNCCSGNCNGTVCIETADRNENEVVSIGELLSYISDWKQGFVNIGDLLGGISEWKGGCHY